MSISNLLEREREQLLDIGTRNRLISTPRKNKRLKQIEIIHERSSDLFDLMIRRKKVMSFLALGEDEDDEEEVGEDGDSRQQQLLSLLAAEAEEPTPEHFRDTKLQTDLNPTKLQKRLRDLFSDSRTFVEEQGVNPLYLALGFLRWRESGSSARDRFAPLILLPVELVRSKVPSQYKLTGSDDDLSTNLSLQQKLKSDFDISLPDLPSAEDLDVDEYFEKVAVAVEAKPEWELLRNDIQLNFFQFAKFLMYRDLDVQNWPDQDLLNQHSLLKGLLLDGFDQPDSIIAAGERIDDQLSANNMVHVVDADSSQMAAIEEVRGGRNLVIQGPPGTGKSQTITNLVATGVREGKKVLFLSEKMAALDVVKQRLESIGLGDMCLELHSNKSRKKTVLDELSRTLGLRSAALKVDHSANTKVDQLKKQLNATVDAIHQPAYQSGLTPFQIFGQLSHFHSNCHLEESILGAVKLKDACNWTPAAVANLREQLAALIEMATIIESPQEHPFRGTGCGILLRSDVEAFRSDLETCGAQVQDLLAAGRQLAASLKIGISDDTLKVGDLKRLCDVADAIVESPDVDIEAISNDVWKGKLNALSDVVDHGLKFQQSEQRLVGRLNEGASEVSVEESRRHLNAYGHKFFLFRIFNGKYRSATNTLREILKDQPPSDIAGQLQILDDMICCQKFQRVLDDMNEKANPCFDAFGKNWNGATSDWSLLQATIDWVKRGTERNLPSQFRRIRSRFKGRVEPLSENTVAVRSLLAKFSVQIQKVVNRLELASQRQFGVESANDLPLNLLLNWLIEATDKVETLTDWVRYRLKREELAAEGLKSIVELIDREDIKIDEAQQLFDFAYHEHLLRNLLEDCPAVAEFSGVAHQATRERFCKADHAMIKATQNEVSNVHRSQIPTGTIGGMKVLRHEMQKKARHKSIRKLIKEAGPAIQNIKPVFMMSPLSIAQYLEPGAVEFDLLLIDEASQVEPVDALGAIARCKQIVVVGDNKQLPPTKFFARSAESAEDDNSDAARDLESILGLAIARGVPQRMLEWHYRSQHPSLITVSNREYYDNRLFVVPSPIRDSDHYGVKFHHVEDGIYDRGGTTTNPIEARVVAEQVIDHARNYPETSLGVAAFSVKQRDAIRDELELLQRDNPDVAPFFQKTGAEEFFTKNLENIQGDERDVIFISVGYGRDAVGYMTQSYGPLNRDGGERRLNVLISRAKQKCTVFSSITADDIDLNRAKALGVVGLKKFLQFAQHGYTDIGEVTGRGFDSEFEREVANAIAGYGHKVETQVGVAGFFIDLAVVDPSKPGRYLLGIECDGASYHSSRSARDRDRLREEVLKARGWKIHRIWSTDWYHQTETELKKVIEVITRLETGQDIESAQESGELTSLPAPEETSESPTQTEPEPEPTETNDSASNAFGIPTQPYLETTMEWTFAKAALDISLSDFDNVVQRIVTVEGPIHREELARRLAAIAGTRAGSRISEAVKKSLMRLSLKARVAGNGDFIDIKEQRAPVVRDRSNVSSKSLRRPENISPNEIALAITLLLKENSNVEREELVKTTAKVLGFSQAGGNFRSAAERVLEGLVIGGEVIDKDGVLSVGDPVKSQERLNTPNPEGQLF